MGMIYKRKFKNKDGTEGVGKTYWIKYYKDGKPYRESTESQIYSDAKAILKQREGAIGKGTFQGIRYKKVFLDELADDLVTEYTINKRKSLVRLKISIDHITTHFEGMKAANLSTDKIEGYIKKRQDDGVKDATINRELAALKRMYSLGARKDPPKVVRVPYIQKLKENNVRQGFFEHRDFLNLRVALPAYLRGMATVGYKFGCRASEITGLTWDNVELQKGIIHLEDTKNGEPRTIVLDQEVREIIEKQWEAHRASDTPVPFVFPNAKGTGRIVNYYIKWRKACKSAGCEGKLFHDLRRTAVRNMIRSGTPEVVAMKISGHMTRSVFDRYNIVNETDLRQASERLQTYLETEVAGTRTGTSDQNGAVRLKVVKG